MHNFADLAVSKRAIKVAEKDSTIRMRLASIHYLVAAETEFHLQCYALFKIYRIYSSQEDLSSAVPGKRLNKLAEEASEGLSHCDIYSLLNVWNGYAELLAEFGIVIWLIQRLQNTM